MEEIDVKMYLKKETKTEGVSKNYLEANKTKKL